MLFLIPSTASLPSFHSLPSTFLSTSYIGKTLFEDTMTYNDKGALVLVKTNEKDGMEITAVRSLEEGGKVLVMVSGREEGRERY